MKGIYSRLFASLLIVYVLAQGCSVGAFGATADSSELWASVVYIEVHAISKKSGVESVFEGTGVIATDQGDVVTVAHIIPNTETWTVTEIKGTIGSKFSYPVKLDRTGLENSVLDVMVLRFPDAVKFKVAQIPQTVKVGIQDRIRIYGFPLDLDRVVLEGSIISLNGPNGVWLTDARAQEGSSGSPVFDSLGLLVGIVSGGFTGGDRASPSPLGLNSIIPIDRVVSVTAGLGWHKATSASQAQCQSTPTVVTGLNANLPTAATSPMDRSTQPTELVSTISSKYPNVVLDGAAIVLPSAGPNILHFCRLEMRNGARLVVGTQPLFLVTNFLSATNSKIQAFVDGSAGAIPDPDPATGVGEAGKAGLPGESASSVLLAVLVRMDGTLRIELDGQHGGSGGQGGPGSPGASGDPGRGGSDSLFDCKRGPGDGGRGGAGGAGGLGGQGGQGGNAGGLQIFRLQSTNFPAKAISFSGYGGGGGAGGLGGPGGTGGRGGPRGSQTTYCHGGSDGPSGASGPLGPNGPSGTDGLSNTLTDAVVGEADVLNTF